MLEQDEIVIGGLRYSVRFFDGCDCEDCELNDWCELHSFAECCINWIGDDQIWKRDDISYDD